MKKTSDITRLLGHYMPPLVRLRMTSSAGCTCRVIQSPQIDAMTGRLANAHHANDNIDQRSCDPLPRRAKLLVVREDRSIARAVMFLAGPIACNEGSAAKLIQAADRNSSLACALHYSKPPAIRVRVDSRSR